MKRKPVIVASIISLSILGSLGTGVKAFAAGPGEVNSVIVGQTDIPTYYQSTVQGLGVWEQQSDGTTRFKLSTGEYLTNSWIESIDYIGSFYFVDLNGLITKYTTTIGDEQIALKVYYQSTIAATGKWEIQSEGGTKFKLNSGGYLVDAWVESRDDNGNFYFVNPRGTRSEHIAILDERSIDPYKSQAEKSEVLNEGYFRYLDKRDWSIGVYDNLPWNANGK